jgi:uncharacterized protein YlxP (DUF503 family)
MYVGTITFDLLLDGDIRSLKQKRSIVRPIVAELRRRFPVSAAEVGDHDLHRRARIGCAVVSGEGAVVRDVLDGCERWMVGRPEAELLSARRALHGPDD